MHFYPGPDSVTALKTSDLKKMLLGIEYHAYWQKYSLLKHLYNAICLASVPIWEYQDPSLVMECEVQGGHVVYHQQ